MILANLFKKNLPRCRSFSTLQLHSAGTSVQYPVPVWHLCKAPLPTSAVENYMFSWGLSSEDVVSHLRDDSRTEYIASGVALFLEDISENINEVEQADQLECRSGPRKSWKRRKMGLPTTKAMRRFARSRQ